MNFFSQMEDANGLQLTTNDIFWRHLTLATLSVSTKPVLKIGFGQEMKVG